MNLSSVLDDVPTKMMTCKHNCPRIKTARVKAISKELHAMKIIVQEAKQNPVSELKILALPGNLLIKCIF